MSKVLFILKVRKDPYEWESGERPIGHTKSDDADKQIPFFSSGLYNSALKVVRMLQESGVEADIVQVIDANQIDKEVTKYKPTHVIIEALWVTPTKFDELRRRHARIDWIVRLHSEIPFLANEGIALEWIKGYLEQHKVYVAANTPEMTEDLIRIAEGKAGKIFCLPNYYPIEKSFNRKGYFDPCLGVIDVGCFGAIRPMKNQLTQAIAAINLADELGVKLNFHINAGRVEQRGSNVLKNIRALFNSHPRHSLVEHGWYPHYQFLEIVAKMDLGMQVSFSETFNIVTADFVNEDVPVVTSHEIDWLPKSVKANPTSISDIVHVSKKVLKADKHGFTKRNKKALKIFGEESKIVWLSYFGG